MPSNFDNVNEHEIKIFYAQVSRNVKKFRLEKELSQMDLALEIDIKSVAFFSNCESNRYGKHFNLEHLYKLAKALDKKLCEFFED